MIVPLLPLWTLLVACEGWPRYANLPSQDPDVLPAGAVIDPGPLVTWTLLPSPPEDGSDDDPREMSAETLGVQRGNYFPARLTGAGWDPADTGGASWEACGDVSTFPPYDNGNYVGDRDWRVVDLQSAGVLCSWFRFNRPGGQADVLVYEVNECNLPTTPFVYGSGDPVGYNVAGQLNTWSYPIVEPRRVALVAAAWAPNDAVSSFVYNWGISLLPTPDADTAAALVCPEPPPAEEDP